MRKDTYTGCPRCVELERQLQAMDAAWQETFRAESYAHYRLREQLASRWYRRVWLWWKRWRDIRKLRAL